MSYPGSEEADGTEQRIPSEPGEWEEYTPGISEAPPRHGRPRTYAAMGTAEEFRGKTLHDKPPQWNGENAERDLRPYLKELSLWLKTTETPKKRQGLAIMGYATGKLKQVIDALDEDDIAHDVANRNYQFELERLQEASLRHNGLDVAGLNRMNALKGMVR